MLGIFRERGNCRLEAKWSENEGGARRQVNEINQEHQSGRSEGWRHQRRYFSSMARTKRGQENDLGVCGWEKEKTTLKRTDEELGSSGSIPEGV